VSATCCVILSFIDYVDNGVDTASCTINTKVVDVSPKADVVQKYTAYTSEYVRPSHEDEHAIVNGMVMHTDVLETMYIEEKKKHIQVEMIVSAGIDVHASGVNGYCNYFGKRCVREGLKESMYDFDHLLARFICYVKIIKTRGLFTFLFLPSKEKINGRMLLIRKLFSLKDVGWGLPAQGHKSATHAPEIVVFVFLNSRSSRLSLCLCFISFFKYVHVLAFQASLDVSLLYKVNRVLCKVQVIL
jgi:hypothetical protein